jgi:hypothetical protein
LQHCRFDGLVFRGSLRRLQYGRWDRNLQSMVAQGMEQYLCSNHILFKDYLDHVKRVSQGKTGERRTSMRRYSFCDPVPKTVLFSC